MDAETPATPLEKAVEEAREVLAGHPVSVSNPRNPRVAAEDALRSLLAALYADRGEAEKALRPFAAIGADATVAEMAALAESEPHAGHGKFGIMWRTHKDGGSIVIEARDLVAARRYFARREEKGENRG